MEYHSAIKKNSFEKTLILGKIEGRRRRGQQRMRWLDGIRVFSIESVLNIGGQSIGVSASASVLPVNIQDLFLLGWTGWMSLQ